MDAIDSFRIIKHQHVNLDDLQPTGMTRSTTAGVGHFTLASGRTERALVPAAFLSRQKKKSP